MRVGGLDSESHVIVSYTYIISTILKIPTASGRRKAFSTCASHFTIVVLGYGSCLFLYVKPNQTQAAEYNKIVYLLVSVVTPFLNPFIFTLRNDKVKEAIRDMTLMGNMVIIVIVCVDKRLQSPMYFFLGHLSASEILFTSTIIPVMLSGLLLPGMQTISLAECVTQLFLYLAVGTTEFALMGVMAVDRYVAVCNPLRYSIIMNSHTCICVLFRFPILAITRKLKLLFAWTWAVCCGDFAPP
ncbi:hypothetical protein QTO34_004629 [Cnephaeus nilssonii]|uniref:G-protein coupled receptors family 1 profile domain-containing protein n=1 Tax=Cnephaeus nilssonii TaxID=3371016 RepID=A0AA40LKJ0_CNENI|nr:hypothetical protein QTO34_004629 [Eptesicus nilssonii]